MDNVKCISASFLVNSSLPDGGSRQGCWGSSRQGGQGIDASHLGYAGKGCG